MSARLPRGRHGCLGTIAVAGAGRQHDHLRHFEHRRGGINHKRAERSRRRRRRQWRLLDVVAAAADRHCRQRHDHTCEGAVDHSAPRRNRRGSNRDAHDQTSTAPVCRGIRLPMPQTVGATSGATGCGALAAPRSSSSVASRYPVVGAPRAACQRRIAARVRGPNRPCGAPASHAVQSSVAGNPGTPACRPEAANLTARRGDP